MDDFNSEKNLHPVFLSNKPHGEDLFQGKSQDRVANNIANILKNNDEIKVIGIDGGWGSGKSNLIEIVKNKLNTNENNKYFFFIYDAWGHQEDLQRRSLLEEMTFFLTKQDSNKFSIIADNEKWGKKLKELLAKSKETEKKTIPSLSFGIVFSGLALVLTPLFKSISELVECNWGKISITSIPLISLILLYFYYFLFYTSKASSYKGRGREAVSKLFYIYQQNQKQEITFEKISEDEPSVKKFREWMKDISKDLKENNLIIVFDNMDRLPSNKILELWSSIHTFFAENSYDNIKVVIPFDRLNIQSAFKNPKSEDNDYTDDYINKTFDIVYRVSPSILSDWKKFFETKWTAAFKSIDLEFSKVIQIFDHLSTSKTPREIVAFINEFVTIAQVCQEVPFRYIALFILSKKIILTNPEGEIIKPTYLKSLKFLYESDEDLPKYIASLVYQIEPERAIEVIFTAKLTSALNNNDKNQITSISDSGFFEDILGKAIITTDNYENSVLGLNNISGKISQKSWDDLYMRLDSMARPLLDSKVLPYQLIILNNITYKERFLKNILGRFRSNEKFTSIDYYNSIKKIEENIKENNLSLKINDYVVERSTTPEDFISLLKTTSDTNTYGIVCNNGELSDFLERTIDSNEGANSAYLSFIPEKYSLTKFIATLENKIKATPGDRVVVAFCYNAYKNVTKKALKSTLKILIEDVHIYNHAVNSPEPKDEFYYYLISMRIAKGNSFQASYASFFEEILAKTDSLTISNLADSIELFIIYGDILINYLGFEKPLIGEVIKTITVKSNFTQKLTIVSILKQIDQILEKTKVDPETFLNRLNAWDSKSVTEKEMPDILKNILFFKLCEKIKNNLTSHCLNMANSYFETLSDDQWSVEFQNPNSTFVEISLITFKNQYPTKAVSAIKEVVLKIAKAEIPIPVKDTWTKIIEKSNKSSFKSAIKDVKDLFIGVKEIDVNSFVFFGEWLFEFGELQSNTNSLRRIFRKAILEDENCVNIIMNHQESTVAVYQNSTEKEDFDNEIRVLIEENKLFIRPLADLLNITLGTSDGK